MEHISLKKPFNKPQHLVFSNAPFKKQQTKTKTNLPKTYLKNPTFGASFGAHLNEWSSQPTLMFTNLMTPLPPDPAEAATTEAVDEVPGDHHGPNQTSQPNEFHHGEKTSRNPGDASVGFKGFL